jgi:F-type H+-transporting ATPase subunit delta
MERTPEAYTRGILAVALEPWMEGLSAVNAAYATRKDLREKLDDPTIEVTAKLSLLDSVLPDGAPATLRNFLGVLLTNNDFGLIDEIVQALGRVMSEEAGGPVKALITSAVELTEEERAEIEKKLIESFGSNLEFVYQVDPDILGGLIVQVGDKLIDDSVRGRLNALRQKIGV